MYYFLSLLTGVIISVMLVFNGGLTEQYGAYTATAVIHITGLALITILTLSKREKPFSQRHAWFLYLGGAIGVITTVFNNLAFGRISVSAILALGLFGQSVMGLLIDQYGLFDMPRHPFDKRKTIGFLLILAGIASMINNFEFIAVTISFAAGAGIVLSRTLNARLADLTSVRTSTFFNYLVGLLVTIPVFFLLGRGEPALTEWVFSTEIYIYTGGVLGVCVVLLSNVTAAKIPAFYLTLFIFVGQVFSGVLIDALISGEFSARNVIGGALVAVGLIINLKMEQKGNM